MSGAPSLSDVLDGRAEAVVTQDAKSKQVNFFFIFENDKYTVREVTFNIVT